MRFALRALVLCGIIFAITGCADPQQQSSSSSQSSTIPWNRPEKWEGTGALGGFANQQ
jgi:hypothetical protein